MNKKILIITLSLIAQSNVQSIKAAAFKPNEDIPSIFQCIGASAGIIKMNSLKNFAPARRSLIVAILAPTALFITSPLIFASAQAKNETIKNRIQR